SLSLSCVSRSTLRRSARPPFFPYTTLFRSGVLAIAGLPFLSGFYSKDAILHLAQVKSTPVFAILVFTAVLTSFYMIRMWRITFRSEEHTSELQSRENLVCRLLLEKKNASGT